MTIRLKNKKINCSFFVRVKRDYVGRTKVRWKVKTHLFKEPKNNCVPPRADLDIKIDVWREF